eukprot:scaffold1945_cov204-Pinguiococcus_pyrenoidosus.AAC.4
MLLKRRLYKKQLLTILVGSAACIAYADYRGDNGYVHLVPAIFALTSALHGCLCIFFLAAVDLHHVTGYRQEKLDWMPLSKSEIAYFAANMGGIPIAYSMCYLARPSDASLGVRTTSCWCLSFLSCRYQSSSSSSSSSSSCASLSSSLLVYLVLIVLCCNSLDLLSV